MASGPADTGRQVIFADRAADLLEHFGRFALGMQRLAPPPGKMPRPPKSLDRPSLVLLGDRRESHDLPRLLRQYVADQIVLVQPMHDQDDGAVSLVVQPAVEGMVEPVVGRL